jgi:hypothetical protein
VGLIPLVLGAVAIASGYVVLGLIAAALGIVALIVVSLIASALNSIIVGALYLYASEGTVPQQFDDQLFRRAFASK